MKHILIVILLGIAIMTSNIEAEGRPESVGFRNMRVAKVISIWLGNFSNEDALLDYLGENFSEDFGFEIYEPAGPEQDVSTAGPKPIHDLLDGFSQHCFVK